MRFEFGEFGRRGGHGQGPGRRHGGFMGRFGFMGGGGAGGFRAARMLASGDLQLVVLALLEEKPRHGYELIKALEEHSFGIYTPSPGVIYPALTYLEEMGFAVSEAEGNKKLYRITSAGKEHLDKNRELVRETMEHLSHYGKKMARFQRHFAEDEAEDEFGAEDPRRSARHEWRKLKTEFRELKDELRSALREKMGAPMEEKQRIMAILRKAVQDIKGK